MNNFNNVHLISSTSLVNSVVQQEPKEICLNLDLLSLLILQLDTLKQELRQAIVEESDQSLS